MINSVSAIEGSMTLLTVVNQNASLGGTASAKLEIREGNGRIFMDSYPLNGIDTQISARYAKEIACGFLELDCSKLDFFYTIRSGSSFVSGPSAGGAFAVLAVALLDGQELRDDIAMTGTINSGGTIGAVGGIQAKVDAAKREGMNAVIIPAFGDDNVTSEIKIYRVKSLEEALFIFTGKNYSRDYALQDDESYDLLMHKVAESICNTTEKFFSQELDKNTSDFNSSLRFKNLSDEALRNDDFYSAASFCFSANIRLRNLLLEKKNDLLPEIAKLKEKIKNLKNSLEATSLRRLSELETYMIVKERVDEAESVIEGINETNISSRQLAYAIERYNSAVSWSSFFEMDGKKMTLDDGYLRVACSNKLEEVNERLGLVRTIAPDYANEEIIEAEESRDSEDFGVCLFRATKAKAEINAIIDGISVDINKTKELVRGKLELVEMAIAKEQSKGSFPILAYSYYNYANALIDEDTTNALIFSEYALEFSNLGIYFPQELPLAVVDEETNNQDFWGFFLVGFFLGVIFSLLSLLIIKRRHQS